MSRHIPADQRVVDWLEQQHPEHGQPAEGAPRDRQRQETRARILQAALDLFAERGFEGASVRDIAKHAGVTHGMIKYHFEDKDRLWRAAVSFLFSRMGEEIVLGPPARNAQEDFQNIKDFIRQYVRYCARHPEHARIMVQASMRNDHRFHWMLDRFTAAQHKITMNDLQRQIDRGLWPDMPAISLTYITAAACQTIFMLASEAKHLHGADVQTEEMIERHADTIIELFFGHRVDLSVNAGEA